MVDPIVSAVTGDYRLTKVLMDGGSSFNLLYADTMRKMGIPESRLQPSRTVFYGIIPGKSAHPMGTISLGVVFGEPDNFRRETLTFEVVDFKSPYHAIFGRPAYAKFMARPCYVYLKMKMPGPKGVITITGDYKKSIECEETYAAIAESLVATEELAENSKSAVSSEALPTPKKPAAESFQADRDTKKITLLPGESSKNTTIGSALDPK